MSLSRTDTQLYFSSSKEEGDMNTWQLFLVLTFSSTTLLFLLTTVGLALQLLRMRRTRQPLRQQGSHTDCSSCSSSNTSCASTEKTPELKNSSDLCSDRRAGLPLLPAAAGYLAPREWSWYPDHQLFPAYGTVPVSCRHSADTSPGRQLD
jgi:hypothetical protein